MEQSDSRRNAGVLARLVKFCGLVAILAAGGWLAADYLVTNPFTPAGSVGYVYEEPRFWGEGGYRGSLEGPRSFGGSWKRFRVVNIEVGPQTHSESLSYPVADGTREVEWELQVRPDASAVREIVEEFGGESWYERHVRAAAAKVVRTTSAKLAGEEVPDMAEFEAEARKAVERELRSRDMPFIVEDLVVRRWNVGEAPVAAVPAAVMAPLPRAGEGPEGESAAPMEPVVEAKPVVSVAREEPELEAWVDAAPPTLIDVSHRREFRGMWLATVSNVDWPSRYGLGVEQQKKELIAYLDTLQEMNMNALVFQVRPAGDAFYDSAMEPWSRFLTGTQGKDPGYDPLAFVIEECRKRSIELHAWFNPFRAMPVEDYKVARNHVTKVLPQFARPYASMMWMDPGAQEVREWVAQTVLDVVTRYDVDGVHLDDYFYPYPKNGVEFNDRATYQNYLRCCGQIEKDDWRRQNVDTLVADLSRRIRAAKPHVKFGVSPFGLYRPGEPEGTKGFDQYAGIYSDPKKWLENGWIDYVTPQLYWREKSNRSYSALLNWWGETNVLRRHIYAGNSLLSIERRSGNWPFSEYETQLNASREAMELQSLGNIFFGLKVFRGREGDALQDRFTEKLYPEPALAPAMPWLGNRPPDHPWHVRVIDNEIRWDAAGDRELKHWALYRRDEETAAWKLQEIFPAATTRTDVEPGSYALSAVDRLMQESIGVMVEVAERVEHSGENVKREDLATDGDAMPEDS